MITIHDLSRDAYTSILREIPQAIRDVEQGYETVFVQLSPATDIVTHNMLKYVSIRYGTKSVSIDYNDFREISI